MVEEDNDAPAVIEYDSDELEEATDDEEETVKTVNEVQETVAKNTRSKFNERVKARKNVAKSTRSASKEPAARDGKFVVTGEVEAKNIIPAVQFSNITYGIACFVFQCPAPALSSKFRIEWPSSWDA